MACIYRTVGAQQKKTVIVKLHCFAIQSTTSPPQHIGTEAQLGMSWRTRWGAAINWLRSRREIGREGRHTFFAEYVGQGQPERRYVEYADGDLTDSSHGMATEWWAWLHGRREDPPTAMEIERSRRSAAALAKRVAALEDEDRRERLRQGLSSGLGDNKAGAVRRERVKERLLRSANEKNAGADAQSAAGETEEFKPEAWTPNSSRRR